MKERFPSFPFYPKDWFDKRVLRMKAEAQGYYIRLLAHIWISGKNQYMIEDENIAIARILGLTLNKWLKIREEIQWKNDPIFIEKKGFLVSKRLRKEWRKLIHRRKYYSDKAKQRWEGKV